MVSDRVRQDSFVGLKEKELVFLGVLEKSINRVGSGQS